MDNLSQGDLDKLSSLETKPNPRAASMAAGFDSRFRRFAGLYSKSISADSGCNLTQEEVDKAFAGSDSAGNRGFVKT
jgi:hypothetical protein